MSLFFFSPGQRNSDDDATVIDGVKDPQEYWKTTQTRGFSYFFLQAFNDYTIILLFLSALLLFVIGTIEQGPRDGWHDAVAVLFAISLLISFSSVGNFWRERKAEKKLLEEKKMTVRVERGGKLMSVFVPEVKAWDTVHLEEGDRVPADGLIMSSEGLRVDEVHSSEIDCDRNPFLVSGSKVEQGHGSMIVTPFSSSDCSLFHDSYFGPSQETLLQALMQKPYEYIEKLGLFMSILIFSIVLIRLLCVKSRHEYFNEHPEMKGHITMKILMEIFEKLVFGSRDRVSTLASALVAVVVGIQHGMPFVIGCCLSHWSNRLSDGQIKIQNLSACCTMGLVTTVVVDVTHGDLFHEKTEVKELWIGGKDITTTKVENIEAIPRSILDGMSVWEYAPKISISTDNQVLASLEKSKWGASNSEEKSRVIEYRRTSSSGKAGCEVLMRRIDYDDSQRSLHLHWKGPPSTILDMCSHFYDCRGEKHIIANDQRAEFHKLIKGMEIRGHMPIAFAYEQTNVRELKSDELNLLAIVSLKYRCRTDVKMLVKALRDVGLIIKLVSEDELPLVESIAWELGFSGTSGENNNTFIEAKKIRELTASLSTEESKKLWDQISVIGNSHSKDKLHMVEKLQGVGHIVAFGGGLSRRDTLALRKADLSFAQESRCIAITKNASDILLKRPHPYSLSQIRRSGRFMYQNIRKFFRIQLTFWISGLVVTLVSTMDSGESPLTSAQMIWVSLVLYLLCGLMMMMELDEGALQLERTELLITRAIWTNILIQAFYQVFLLLAIHFFTLAKYASTKDVLDTMIFNTFALCQIFNLLISMHVSKKEVLEVVLGNHRFLWALLVVLMFQVMVVELQNWLLSSDKLGVRTWVICFLMAAFSSMANSVFKLLLSWLSI